LVTHHFQSITPELLAIQAKMEGHARDYGLDFFPTIFELVDIHQLNAVAAYNGFPTRYPHWRFGMEYERLAKGYSYGLQKIYELVINNDPCYAYLLNSNSMTDHKLVIAHVYGHCDFFKNNQWFSQTNRKMLDETANHGARIRRYMNRFGVEQVEEFIDACLSIEDLIDIHSPHIQRYDKHREKYEFLGNTDDSLESENETRQFEARRFEAKAYMEHYVNPPAALAREQLSRDELAAEKQAFPSQPMQDVMLFLLESAPLEPWQRDVLSIIREEAYYFAPQGQTKIMNEGWATFWHSTIMTRHGLDEADVISYADHCAGTLATSPSRLNPYKIGLELFRHIEDRWNRGQFGSDYDECDDHRERQHWNTSTGLGREKIFQVRQIYNDVTFIDEFLTLEFCREHKLFQFGYNARNECYEIESRQFEQIKQQLLFNLTNMGRPIIRVKDGNYKNRGELYLQHEFQGPELKTAYALDTLANLYRLWQRPVHIETVLDEQITVITWDESGGEINKTDEKISADNQPA